MRRSGATIGVVAVDVLLAATVSPAIETVAVLLIEPCVLGGAPRAESSAVPVRVIASAVAPAARPAGRLHVRTRGGGGAEMLHTQAEPTGTETCGLVIVLGMLSVTVIAAAGPLPLLAT